MLEKLKLPLANPVYLLIIGIAVFYIPTLSNTMTVVGDGSRIFDYVSIIDHSRELFPLWNPYKALGMPMLADPERFTWIGWLLDLRDPLFFLKLNFINFILASSLAGALYAFYRACGLSSKGSALAAFAVVTSGVFGISYYLGRLYGVISLAGALACLTILIKSATRPSLVQQFVLSGITGLSISTIGYYACLLPLGFIFIFIFIMQGKGLIAFRYALLETLKYACWGMLLFAILIIPAFYYNMHTIDANAEKGLLGNLPDPASFFNSFFPLSTSDRSVIIQVTFPYIFLLLLPGLALFTASKERMPELLQGMAFLAAVCVFVVLLKMHALSWIIPFYEKLPFISHIRQPGIYIIIFAVMGMGLAVAGMESASFDKKKLRWSLAAALVLLVFSVAFSPSFKFIKTHGVALGIYVAIFCIGLSLYPQYSRYRYAVAGLYIAAALGHVIFTSHLVHQPFVTKKDGTRTLSRLVSDIPARPVDVFLKDQDYYRVYCDAASKCPPLGAGATRGVQGFSLHFAPAARPVMQALSVDGDLHQRPHWMKFKKCKDIEPIWMEILNVKYILCAENDTPPENFKLLETQGKTGVFIDSTWRPSLLFFSAWRVNSQPAITDVLKSWKENIALIDANPGSVTRSDARPAVSITPKELSEGKVIVNFRAESEGILYLPEIYDSDWNVRVNGHDAVLLKVFGSFRGVALNRGYNHVVFEYRPLIVYISAAISLLASVVSLLVIIFERARKTKAGCPSP